MRIFTILLFIFSTSLLSGQIVTLDPTFPDRTEEITITYDATQGNGGLIGENQVYMHTGLITNTSSSPSDWKFVIGNWGTDDGRVKMTNIGNNKHELKLTINDFYDVPESVIIEKLAFVFRNVNGSKEGKTDTNGDIFIDYSDSESFTTDLISPTKSTIIAELDDVINIKFSASEVSNIQILDNGIEIFTGESNTVDYNYTVLDTDMHTIRISAQYMGELQSESFKIIVSPEVTVEDYPIGSKLGINQLSEESYRLLLYAPHKMNAYVVGDFNDWQVDPAYFMKRSTDGSTFWIELNELDPNQNHAFQYLIDGEIKVADPFSELVLDPNNDQWIAEETFPALHPYPSEKTNGYVSLLKTGAKDYAWQNQYEPIPEEDLVIYEVLLRDFVSEHNYQTLLDTLDYLDRLGINAIELMPVNEFEGNQSWGYNPSFHMALDKYYGTPTAFKTLIDECHKRGIAVILDVVYNHVFSQSPLAQMYWDAANFRPSDDNPFLNVVARHPFNVGYDVNHESEYSKSWVKRVTEYWLEEYNIDGFRFDLSKGFTQKQSSDDGVFAAYDANRIATLKEYADHIWEKNPDTYVILEHFATNSEEKELADHGMMLWSNHNYNFNEGTMGYTSGGKSDFSWMDYKSRGWANPHNIAYMESHDEERLMYKNNQFGNSNGSYTVKDLETGLKRIEMASAFFYMMPGPKLLWQFGEVGYDFSINRCEDGTISNDCRLSPKPIRWDYKEDLNRKRLLDITTALIHLKTTTNITNTDNYSHEVSTDKKFIQLVGNDLQGLVIGNFNVTNQSINVDFPHIGTWYDYLSNASIEVEEIDQVIPLQPGEYHVYLDQDIENNLISGVEDPDDQISGYRIYPNPTHNKITINIELNTGGEIQIMIYNQNGQLVQTNKHSLGQGINNIHLNVSDLPSGTYHLLLQNERFRLVDRMVVLK